MTMTTTAPPEYWNGVYSERLLRYDPMDVPFKDVFERYLRPGGSCFEVGCYPGTFLIYLGQRFGYSVGGIDTAPQTISSFPGHIASHDVRVGEFHQEDFFTFQAPRTYDVVCSFGFIEHFTDYLDVLDRHVRLLSPGGTLVISCPNFRYLQYCLHRWLDPVNLSRHVLAAMDPVAWRGRLQSLGMEVLHAGYHGTAGFWTEDRGRHWLKEAVAWRLQRLCDGLDRRVKWPNRWLSPHLICVARKAA